MAPAVKTLLFPEQMIMSTLYSKDPNNRGEGGKLIRNLEKQL